MYASNRVTTTRPKSCARRENRILPDEFIRLGIPEHDAVSLVSCISRNVAKPPVDPSGLMQLFTALKTEGDWSARDSAISALEALFSHPETLQCSFQLTDGDAEGPRETSVHPDRVIEFYRSALDTNDVRVIKTVHLLVRRLLRHWDSYRERVSTSRAFLILMLYTVVQKESQIELVATIVRIVSDPRESVLADLTRQLEGLETDHMKAFLGIFQQYLSEALLNPPPVQTHDIQNVTRMIEILYDVNLKSEAVGHEAFYNDAINGPHFDIGMDFGSWIDDQDPSSFSLCNFPFLFDSGSKSQVMQQENSIAQDLAFEGAFWRALHISEESEDSFCPFLLLRVRRGEHLLQDTIEHIQAAKERHLLKCTLKVQFEGEEGVDEGGLTKEFFQLLLRQLFDVSYGMFTQNDQTHLWWFRCSDAMKLEHEFELVGTLLGLAIFNNQILDLRFPLVVYKKLLGHALDVDDLREVYPEIHRSFKLLLEMERGVSALGLYFCVDHDNGLGEHQSVDLIKDGRHIKVTRYNRANFVEMYTKFLLETSIKRQFDAFRAGFLNICLSRSLQMFLPAELEQAVCGRKEIDLDGLEETTSYADGYRRSSRVIRWFWSFARELDDEKRRKLLSFVTGSDRVPIRGFADLVPRFTIARWGPHAQRLPTAHTCFNILFLPDYASMETVTKQMTTAIENSEGFGLV